MKRIISLLLIVSVFLSFVPGVFGSEFKQNNVVSYFNSLYGYESGPSDANLPVGWSLLFNASNRAKLVDSASIGNTTVMKLSTDAGLLYAFDEVVSTGKIHASFDMKVEDASNSKLSFYGYNARVNNNPKIISMQMQMIIHMINFGLPRMLLHALFHGYQLDPGYRDRERMCW